mmetsp:Transcript_16460/g.19470  ORF Transcript_16460/g.19470 Transcript_16460/m.19470 type:complete len:119 (+) Transcript_16460:80-436(+)|eukprot:CAMPEP_0114351908 /NCGR_PEP_ID=MMETSP0101-20121206/17545_1 /TAXON_ID=38822 ORGANISM="Pteridomonas danica, Strain PT" /NCGR_SAMPLE_ID=MMETSP0101 /ASSEMBLY_ACC=CAM_ASM_000211 /LENGTH=118 /DNA_ID=CAMNT_0001492037 /DNA_START=40 /DNA_END=396 /DNA_ORIENTATION=+
MSVNEDNDSFSNFDDGLFFSLTSQVELIVDQAITLSEVDEPETNEQSVQSDNENLAEQLNQKVLDARQFVSSLPMIQDSIENIHEKQRLATKRLKLLQKAQSRVDELKESLVLEDSDV